MVTDAVAPRNPGSQRQVPGRTRWAPVVALGLAMVVVTSDVTVVAVALPGIGADLAVSPAATAWVVLAHALPIAAVAIPAGRWADGADTRSVFTLGLVVVGAASVLTALAPTFWVVVVGRLVQGVAGAVVVAAYMPIITASVRPEQRGRAIGYVVSIMTVGSLAAAPLGGVVAGALGWRAVFLIKIPLLVVALWAGARGIPRIPGRGLPRPGMSLLRESALLGGAVAAVLLAFEVVDGGPVLAAALLVAGAGLGIWWSRLSASAPVLRVVRQPAYAVAMLSLLATSMYSGLISFLLPYFVSGVLGGSAELTGIVLLFFVGAMTPVSFVAGALTDRVGTTLVAVAGSAVGVAGLASMIWLDAGAGLLDMGWRFAVLGVGAALFNTAVNAAMLANAPAGSEGVAGGVGMTARTIAMTIGPSVAALVWTVAGGGVPGFRAAVVVITVSAAVGLAVLLVPVRRRGPST